MAKNAHTLLLVTAAGIALASCGAVEPSSESIALQKALIPKVVAWSRTTEPSLPIASILEQHQFAAICMVPDYNCLDDVKSEAVALPKSYKSSFGKCVPENNIAFVGIKEGVGHGALLDKKDVRFDTLAFGTCVPSNRAVLRKSSGTPARAPMIKLEGE